MKNHPTRQPAVISLIWNLSSLLLGNISLSFYWLHHLYNPETHIKFLKIYLNWYKKTINPQLQPVCFSLVHIKVQQNWAFHLKNVWIKDDFKRCIYDCEFTTVVRAWIESWNPKYWLRQQDISSYHWVAFCPNPKLKFEGK